MMDPLSIVIAVLAIFILAQLFPGSSKVFKEGEAQKHPKEWQCGAAYKAQSPPYADSDRLASNPRKGTCVPPLSSLGPDVTAIVAFDIALTRWYLVPSLSHAVQHQGLPTASGTIWACKC